MGRDYISDIVEWAESQGWTVQVDKNGYRRFFDLDGNYIVRYPATPSNPHRRRLDVLTAVKKAGLPWPAPSKKEQRAQRRTHERDD
ncbi:hypothetical protein A5765_02375 [Mycolicibacterium celeriflavum]|uniref:hypothetical protein n=1 Tax=Mycolicibacterium celeriflavum TaxID=1249101 RepID=UPI0008012280|nr:hypothetical protein [Mycolicibacterium celeriflavum]OBG19440.1 hypothetical protein A5765_02375 [Mycolicibacterium celeriflavum]